MKKIFLILFCMLFLACSNTENVKNENKPCAFKESLLTVGFSGRNEHQSVVFDDKMWVIAGWFESDVWYSIDGSKWELANDSADFSTYFGHQAIVFDDKIWIIGGHDATEKKNDVWNSIDGKHWELSTRTAEFSPRVWHTCLVFKDKIWVIGGIDNNEELKNDVWYSNDGKHWALATSDAGFSPRATHTSVVFNNKMWVIAGEDSGAKKNDIWYSENGIDWIEAVKEAEFPERSYHTSVVFNNKIWIIGGSGYDGFMVYKNDIWNSGDGIKWKKIEIQSGFSKRYGHSSVVFLNKIWVIGGRGGKDVGDFKNDVWYSVNENLGLTHNQDSIEVKENTTGSLNTTGSDPDN